MMLSGYNSISDSNNSPDRMNLEKVDQNASNKKYLFIGLISGISGMIIGIIMCIIIGPSLQSNGNNGLVSSHVNLEQLDVADDQLEDVQQPSNFDFGNDANMVANMVANMANGEKYANSHDFSSSIDISSDASVYVYTWAGKATLTDLSDGNIVTIRSAVYGSYLQNPSSTNKVKTELIYQTNRHLWIVGKDESKNAYSFKNLEDNCYLQSDNGQLKCMQGEFGKIYWLGEVSASSGDSSDYKKPYSELKNYYNNECPYVGSATDDKISMSKSNCDFTESGFRFEIMN